MHYMKYLIVGLGNIGDTYTHTRHNIPWLIFDEYIDAGEWSYDRYADADIATIGDIFYVKPHTLMNLSGKSVRVLRDRYEIPHDHIIIIHDDLDILFGQFKIVYNRGDAGHNGIKSVRSELGGLDIVRIRIGIAKKGPDDRIIKPAVLGKHTQDELSEIPKLAQKIQKALQEIITNGHESAMNAHNNQSM